MPCLREVGTIPSLNDWFMRYVMIGARMSVHSFKSFVGIMSFGDVLSLRFLMMVLVVSMVIGTRVNLGGCRNFVCFFSSCSGRVGVTCYVLLNYFLYGCDFVNEKIR